MYYIVYGFLWLISLLPMRILFFISDVFYVIIYYGLQYRRKVVMDNLDIAFPEKTIAEKTAIAKKFYHNLVDSFVETIKMLSVGQSFYEKRCIGNYEIANDIFATGKSIQVHLGHTFNWEWANLVMARKTPFKFLIVYMPITNKIIDRLFLHIRQAGGAVLIPAGPPSLFRRTFITETKSQYLLTLVADQNPGGADKAYWLPFFGEPTAFVTGPEKSARSAGLPVLYCHMTKPRRGYYDITMSLAQEDPRSQPEGALTRQYAAFLEKVIREHPETWLWSHKRWKHKWKPEYANLWIGETAPPQLEATKA